MKEFNACYILSLNNIHTEYNYLNMFYKSLETLNIYYNIDNLYILIPINNVDENIINDIENNIHKLSINSKNINVLRVNTSITNNIKYPINSINTNKIDRAALLKFFIPYLVDVKNIFYFDCDILFFENCLHYLTRNISNKTLFKSFSSTYNNTWDIEKNHGIIKHFALNSGLIYFNCNLYRDMNVIDSVIKYYDENYKTCIFIDQSGFTDLWENSYKEYSIIEDGTNINININPNTDLFDDFDINNLKPGIYHVWGYFKDQPFSDLYNRIKDINIKK